MLKGKRVAILVRWIPRPRITSMRCCYQAASPTLINFV